VNHTNRRDLPYLLSKNGSIRLVAESNHRARLVYLAVDNQKPMHRFDTSQPRRRHVLRAAGGVGLAAGLNACNWVQNLPVTVAAHMWVGYQPMYLARERGWLKRDKVTLLDTHSATESLAAVRSGKADAAAVTLDEMLTARATGLPLTAVLVFNSSVGADMLLAEAGMTHLSQLKGQRIALERSSVAEIMLAEILREAGLKRSGVQLLHMPVDEHPTAWHRHGADAFITYEPVASQLLARGLVRLFDTRQIPDTIVDVLAFHRDALDNRHADATRHLLLAHFQALDALVRNPQDAAYRLSSRLALPAPEVLQAFKGLVLPQLQANHRLLTGEGAQLVFTAQRVSEILQRGSGLSSTDKLQDLVNGDYLPTEGLLK
jgi:NitT/TauT family transport system substrate-binding protein